MFIGTLHWSHNDAGLDWSMGETLLTSDHDRQEETPEPARFRRVSLLEGSPHRVIYFCALLALAVGLLLLAILEARSVSEARGLAFLVVGGGVALGAVAATLLMP